VSSGPFPLPPVARKADGRLRRIGVEIELIGLDIERLTALVAEQVGGRAETRSADEHRVVGDPAGEWGVELDFEFLKRWERRAQPEADGALEQVEKAARDLLRAGAQQVVPLEVVSPPLPMDQLPRVQALIERLREAGALGTRARWSNAFGLQLNPEMPALDAGTVLRYLQAYLCLEPWLVERAGVDLARELTGFASPFPTRYARTVTAEGYAPGLPELIDDYLADNPTRNRALDFLPLFAELDEERLRRLVDDPRVKARPALHYRLPNSEIDEPGWGLHVPWSDWLRVEELVAAPDRLAALCERYRAHLARSLGRLFESWPREVDEWLTGGR
jgi:hypothetical protein